MFLGWSCSYLWPIHWSQMLSRKWRRSCSSADRQCSNRQCSNYIWVIRILMPTKMRLIFKIWWYVKTSFSMAEKISPVISALHIKGSGTHLKTDKKDYLDVTWASWHCWPFVREIHWSTEFPLKGWVIQKCLQCLDAFMKIIENRLVVYRTIIAEISKKWNEIINKSCSILIQNWFIYIKDDC